MSDNTDCNCEQALRLQAQLAAAEARIAAYEKQIDLVRPMARQAFQTFMQQERTDAATAERAAIGLLRLDGRGDQVTNSCDGCARGLVIVNGLHVPHEPDDVGGRFYCTRSRYEEDLAHWRGPHATGGPDCGCWKCVAERASAALSTATEALRKVRAMLEDGPLCDDKGDDPRDFHDECCTHLVRDAIDAALAELAGGDG